MSKEQGKFGSFKEEVTDLVIKRTLSPREISVLMYVHCKTISWPKSDNELQFRVKRRIMARDTNLNRFHLSDTIKALKKKGWLLECPDEDDYFYYALNPKSFKSGLIIPPKSPIKAKVDKSRNNGDNSDDSGDNSTPPIPKREHTVTETGTSSSRKGNDMFPKEEHKPVQDVDDPREFDPSLPSSSPINTTVSHNGGNQRELHSRRERELDHYENGLQEHYDRKREEIPRGGRGFQDMMADWAKQGGPFHGS